MKDDQSIERLLRSAKPSPPAPGGIGPCLDAETLAAWVDGGLTSKALRQAELHVSSCARCQAAVAATMTSAPLVSSEAEISARTWSFRWLVPLAAGVAAAGLWFMVPSRSELVAPAPESSQVALDRQAAQAPIEQPPQASPRDQRAPESSVGKLADAAPKVEERKDFAPTVVGKPDVGNPQTANESPARARQEAEANKTAKNAADSFAPSREELSARAVEPSPGNPSAPSAVATPPSAPAANAAASDAQFRVSGAAQAAPRAAVSSNAVTRSANLQTPFEVVSPNPTVRWRVSLGGSIDRSSDAGATWTPQSSGVAADLLAGASPLPEVCWLVGRSGTVLRTTDGGQQWRRVTFVGSFDLQAVTATDASTAEVTATDGRRFRTVDAGITWR
jgi:hypothetical protein